jgi:SAM-dependent MidA family methyltransferase
LVEGAAGDLASLPDRERLPLAREIRELTLPGAMGEKFQVMALSRGLDPRDAAAPLAGFRGPGLAHRL